ncbi:MAG: dihydrolipoamide acetyltransferase family protein [Candidatus Methylomirabilales bacterium]
MAIEVVMPQMGQSVAEGTILTWLKREGEVVERDEPLLTISTDKVEVEIPAPATGRLLRILVPEGETVPVGACLAHLQTEGAASGVTTAGGEVPPPAPRSRQVDEAGSWHSPAVLDLARREGVDLSQVKGTGQGGRITKKDVLAFVATRKSEIPAERPPKATISLSPLRRTIAANLLKSTQTIPHATGAVEVDLTRLEEFRHTTKARVEAASGIRLTALPFIARAAVKALGQHSHLNATFEEGQICPRAGVDLGIAVAISDGLVVPVLRGAEHKSLLGLAEAIQDLATRARQNRLTPEEVRGGSFTLNNLGISGLLFGTPILVHPQVAMLGVGAIERRPAVRGEAIVIRTQVYLCLTFDHRVVDGVLAGEFLHTLKGDLEEPDLEALDRELASA